MLDALIRHEEEMCYVERALSKASGHAKADLRKRLERMKKQRLEYLRYIDGRKEMATENKKSL